MEQRHDGLGALPNTGTRVTSEEAALMVRLHTEADPLSGNQDVSLQSICELLKISPAEAAALLARARHQTPVVPTKRKIKPLLLGVAIPVALFWMYLVTLGFFSLRNMVMRSPGTFRVAPRAVEASTVPNGFDLGIDAGEWSSTDTGGPAYKAQNLSELSPAEADYLQNKFTTALYSLGEDAYTGQLLSLDANEAGHQLIHVNIRRYGGNWISFPVPIDHGQFPPVPGVPSISLRNSLRKAISQNWKQISQLSGPVH